MVMSTTETRPENLLHKLAAKLQLLEDERVKSFKDWKFAEDENCSRRKMAEAGFYYSGVSEEDDSATCFVCGKILDGWEENDEPWREHEKHAPNCKFVRLRLKQDDYQVGEFIDMILLVLKAHVAKSFLKKQAALLKIQEETREAIKKQQL